jgi:aminoglycoside 3-N-acetyltransferase
MPELTRSAIAAGLHTLGLRAGMGVMVHSSLRSFGRVEGGAPTVIEALMDVLTPNGTLLMPSFNHGVPFEDDGPGVYDPRVTPTINGAIPGAFWRMPGVHRSLDPTHPIAAWGQHAERYTQHHHRTLTMGSGSPLGLLNADRGYGLLLGIDTTYNTFHHVIETTLNVPCLGKRTEAYPVQLPDGRRVLGRTWGWRDGDCPFTDENRYGTIMAERGLQRQRVIGNCTATLFRLQDCFAVVAELLRDGGFGFPPCSGCAIRPRVNEHTVESDWDAVSETLKLESAAWGY